MMEGNTLLTLGLLIALVIIFILVFFAYIVILKKYNLNGKINSALNGVSTKKMDEGEDSKKCEICLGVIGDSSVAVCTCGKIFHDACAKPTGACPYCNAKYEDMEIRDPIKSRCPVCGRFVIGSICECGAVLPRSDNTFICKCGNRVDADKPVCKKCGAVYESVSMQVYKEK